MTARGKRPRPPRVRVSARTEEVSLIEELEATPLGQQEMAAARLALSVTVALDAALAARHMSAAGLARLLGVSDGAVSQVLNSDGNLRIATIGRYARALGYQPLLQLRPAEPEAPALDLPIQLGPRWDMPPSWMPLEVSEEPSTLRRTSTGAVAWPAEMTEARIDPIESFTATEVKSA